MKLLAREFELIERVFARASKRHDVTISIGDDAAITRVPAGYELVTTTDSLVAGTHFEHGADPVSVGHRSLAVNLSDLAAMGAEPCWVSIALHIPALDEAWVEGFAAGFFALAERHNIDLIGGDTVRGWLAVTITAQGIVPEDAAVLRSGAHAGDALYVTGFPGTAAFARIFKDQELSKSFEFPEPRVTEALALRDMASAMIDVSDGLDSDIRQLLRASRLGAALDVQALPVEARLVERLGSLKAAELAMFGGEDYELLFTVPEHLTQKLAAVTSDWSVPVTRLGTLNDAEKLSWILDGAVYTPREQEFRHFA